jgi:hypothetical protein
MGRHAHQGNQKVARRAASSSWPPLCGGMESKSFLAATRPRLRAPPSARRKGVRSARARFAARGSARPLAACTPGLAGGQGCWLLPAPPEPRGVTPDFPEAANSLGRNHKKFNEFFPRVVARNGRPGAERPSLSPPLHLQGRPPERVVDGTELPHFVPIQLHDHQGKHLPDHPCVSPWRAVPATPFMASAGPHNQRGAGGGGPLGRVVASAARFNKI